MVKSPDLLGGLLNKEVDRRRILEIAGFTGAVAALAACSGDNHPKKEPASPSTANTQTETADARPTPPPTQEATPTPEAVEQKPLLNPEQIVSREKMDKLFILPNWDETLAKVKENGGGERDAADVIATHMVEIVNGLLNPLTLVDENKIAKLGLGQHTQSDELEGFCRSLQRYVTDRFTELAIVDATQGSIPESLKALERGGVDDTFVALLTECGESGSLNGDKLFSRKATRQMDINGTREVLYYTDFPTTPHKKRIETTVDMQDNLEPKPSSAVCQKIDGELRNGNNSKKLTFDFVPPAEDGSMQLMDIVIKRI